ncbi:MAG: UMP kinase [Alphaproteobacteria bacterium]
MSNGYKRVLLKLSGEVLMGDKGFGWDPATLSAAAEDIKRVHDNGHEICLVIGAGNIVRGAQISGSGIDRVSGDHMGMLATVMNALAMQSALEHLGLTVRTMSALNVPSVCEPLIVRRARRHLEKGRVVILAGGTGNPYVTTDTAAALRAAELKCDAILKGTSVDGVYEDDPKTNPDARRFDKLSFQDVLAKNLKVMDASAIAMARDSNIPILVFSLKESGAFAEAAQGEGRYTLITRTESVLEKQTEDA